MSVPGFTAEASLETTSGLYYTVDIGKDLTGSVYPAMICRERGDGWLECLHESGEWKVYYLMA